MFGRLRPGEGEVATSSKGSCDIVTITTCLVSTIEYYYDVMVDISELVDNNLNLDLGDLGHVFMNQVWRRAPL